MLKMPIVIVNFKTYPEATGENAVALSSLILDTAQKRGVNVAVAPQATDVFRVANKVKIPVLAQHIDPIKPGKNTGWTTPESARAAGAVGTLVNHAEHKLPLDKLEGVIARAREIGLTTVACSADTDESIKIAGIGPDIIAVEPPELIGSGVSVSKAKPDVITNSVKAVKDVNSKIRVLCGAGVTTGEDVAKALKLGAEGVLLASGIILAKDQRAAIEDVVKGMVS